MLPMIKGPGAIRLANNAKLLRNLKSIPGQKITYKDASSYLGSKGMFIFDFRDSKLSKDAKIALMKKWVKDCGADVKQYEYHVENMSSHGDGWFQSRD